jgi:hypothetical protein
MSGNSLNIKRAANNSLLLYVRMIFVMLFNLYTVRIVLNSLGYVDYGINDVVAGVVTMLISVSSVLATATQRFYSFSSYLQLFFFSFFLYLYHYFYFKHSLVSPKI